MKSDLKIVFMGTPEFSVTILDKIINSGYNVVGVVSTPDKPSGRGQKVHSSAVTKYAKKHNLKLMQPPKLKAKSFIEELQTLNADVFVVVAFRMLPKLVWAMPRLGTFNLHASLLPQYRGAAPINWAIINGEKESGITTFLLDENIDTGNILLQEKVTITNEETAGTLHDKLMIKGADLVVQTIKSLGNSELIPKSQEKAANLKDAPKLFKENTKINWENSLENIYNFIRGLNPYPSAWTYIDINGNKKFLKIFKVEIEQAEHSCEYKQIIIQNKKLGITHKEGYIWLIELQLEGKKRMNTHDFINGLNKKDNTLDIKIG